MKKRVVKLLCAILLTCSSVSLFFVSGCSSTPDYISYVSELRKDLFVGEQDGYTVVVYAGTKEEPAIFDGVKNQSKLYLGFKVILKEECCESPTVNFEIGDKKYSANLEFNPVKSTLFCETEVASLPEKSLTVEIVCKDNQVTLTTYSKLKEDTISYKEALEKAVSKAQPFLKEHTQKGVLKAEIIIRLLCENDRNYYYVGFVCDEGLKRAYLINGKTGEVLAEKSN